jgi:hypothetical protein
MARRSTFLALGLVLSIGHGFVRAVAASDQTADPVRTSPARASGRLEIIVIDPAGGLVLSAIVEARSATEGWRRLTAERDRWTADALEAGSYAVRVTAPGFERQILDSVRVGRGTTTRTVRLALEPLQATVVVERDRQTVALDPRGFSTYLSREQIAALPDDPVELERVLREMAPPGAVMRIDGFTGGMMPPKSQILSIRIPRLDALAAEDHGGLNAFSAVDVMTRPGGGTVQGNFGVTGGTSKLNARNPLSTSRLPARAAVVDAAFDGPLIPDRMSFALSLRGSGQENTATIRAAVPGNDSYVQQVTQPTIGLGFTGRLTAALPREQVVRGSFTEEQRETRHAGIGDYNLEERGYTSSSLERLLRVSIGGPWGQRRNVDSRAQLRWNGARNQSLVEGPTIQVLDAFTGGGAQATSGERGFSVFAASDMDYARSGHAWRAGGLVDAAHHAANRRANYLGTYIFPSLAAFESGRPAFFTRRFGDARVSYTDLQLGAYVQDNYRVSRSVLASYGLRAEWQNLTSNAPALLPRLGLTWSPRRRGTSTVRASWGLVRDWLPSGVYEQAQLVDGRRQYDLRIATPQFPVASDSGNTVSPELFRLADGVALPRGNALALGFEQQLSPSIRVFVSTTIREGRGLLRGRNINPIIEGHRLDESLGNVIETVGDARLKVRTLTLQSIYSSPVHRLDASVSYILNRSRSNTAGAFWLPPSGDPDREWGAVTATHAASGSITGRARGLVLTLSSYWRTGMPYTVTLAEATEDGFFTARPPGVTRSGSRTPPQAALGARISYGIGLGATKGCSPMDAGCGLEVPRPGTGSANSITSPERRRFRLEFQGSAQNLTNRPNYLTIGNILGSPMFGRPVSAGPPRSIDLGVRFWF